MSSHLKSHSPILQKGSDQPLYIKLGEALLLFILVSFLAGRFTLNRLLDDAINLDLRYFFLVTGLMGTLLWTTGAKIYLPKRSSGTPYFPLLCWGIWMILTSAWSPPGTDSGSAIEDIFFLVTLVALGWSIMCRLPISSLEKVWQWLVIVGLAYFILAIVAGPDHQGRFSAPGGGPNTFVRIMVAAALASLFQAIAKKRHRFLLAVPIFVVGAVLSGSRGGILSAAIILIFFSIPIAKHLKAKRSVALVISIIAVSIPAIQWNDGYVVDFIYQRFVDQTIENRYASGRDIIADQAIDMYASNPIFGVGLNGFSTYDSHVTAEYAHNLFLSVLAEGGTIGGIFLIVLLISLIMRSRLNFKSRQVLFSLSVGLYFLISSMFSGDYFDSRFIWFFLGLAAISAVKEDEARSTGSLLK